MKDERKTTDKATTTDLGIGLNEKIALYLG